MKYNIDEVIGMAWSDRISFEQIKKKVSNYPNIKFFNNEFLDSEEKFDTIMYLNVLEHIENDEDEILYAFNKLNKNGFIFDYWGIIKNNNLNFSIPHI